MFVIKNEKIMLLGICVLRDNRSRDGRIFLGGVFLRGARVVTCKVVPLLLNTMFNVMG